MSSFKKLRFLLLSQWLLLLAMGLSMTASLSQSSGGFGQDVKTELMREASRLQRVARSVRKGVNADLSQEEEEGRAVPAEPLDATLANQSFAQLLAGYPLTEIDESLLQPYGGSGLHEIGIPRGSPFYRRTLSDLGLGETYSLSAVALKREGQELQLKPPPGTRLRKGDVLLVLGPTRDADALRAELA